MPCFSQSFRPIFKIVQLNLNRPITIDAYRRQHHRTASDSLLELFPHTIQPTKHLTFFNPLLLTLHYTSRRVIIGHPSIQTSRPTGKEGDRRQEKEEKNGEGQSKRRKDYTAGGDPQQCLKAKEAFRCHSLHEAHRQIDTQAAHIYNPYTTTHIT